MGLVQQKPKNGSVEFRVLSRRTHTITTHLPGDDPERVGVASLRTFGINKPEVLRVNQFRGSAVEESIDADPRHGGWNGSHTEAGNMDTSTSINEDVSLDKCERRTKTRVEESSHNLEVSMNNVEAMHTLHVVRYSQRLALRY